MLRSVKIDYYLPMKYRRTPFKARRLLTVVLTSIIAMTSCFTNPVPKEYRFLGSEYNTDIIRLLEEQDYSSRFVLIDKTIRRIYQQRGIDDLRSFIDQYTSSHSDDPYNAYYVLLLGDYYAATAPELSEYYYQRLLTSYPDVIVAARSSHFMALNGLLGQITSADKRIAAYRQLIERFPADIDLGLTWFNLAQEYRNHGLYAAYYDALQEFTAFPNTRVPGRPNIHQDVLEELAFHFNREKDWTSPSLETLVANISNALRWKSPAALERHRSKENFFAMSWFQETSDLNARPENFRLENFLLAARYININPELTMRNSREALLHTWGWGYRVRNWYFYFRKIDYPADPEIHGNWEWAGIYFGNNI